MSRKLGPSLFDDQVSPIPQLIEYCVAKDGNGSAHVVLRTASKATSGNVRDGLRSAAGQIGPVRIGPLVAVLKVVRHCV